MVVQRRRTLMSRAPDRGQMDDRPHILLADYVPMANKGEEAIVRGMEDMLSEGRPVALGLFDNVPQVVQRENITIFPRRGFSDSRATRPVPPASGFSCR